ncbi:acyl-CoA synthetase (AMP-forming)/AMP-acid ligase II [Paenarthrobacter nicotinovorans]|uniref:class I adenylate-forming enzyme family protein n=1 Tax=Micrococcaceae TaxID=1268 RepID=UPI0008760D50|nr:MULTISPECIES: AMP-binding protein [Micrococcaceae]MDR6438702.1 acyl-CoA synthetase (AMP-forming)/AMP-acid ligase II [Paenarthrobacter nicotinovorans]SCZ56516.1 Acyl-CoA synthetase (AMP-forming)/AMP-acid ligase II [Arthrobacter sp. UNCCL28]
MPFLNRLQKWADLCPDGTAVAVDGRGFTWSELRGAAEELVPDTPETYVLAEPNTAEFAALYCAGIAGSRRVAVVDPAWTAQTLEEIAGKLPGPTCVEDTVLEDGDAESTFLIGFTAGTTGTPKAFTRSRRSWQASFDSSIRFFNLREDDRTLAPGPLSASLNLYALSECLYAGAEFHTLRNFDVGEAHEVIVHHGITRLVVVPTTLRLISERGLMASVDGSAIRTIICAGSKLDARTLEAARRWAPNATIFEYYGAAELSFVSGRGIGSGTALDAAGTAIGSPFPGVEVRILDDSGKSVPDGTPGNISIRSSMVCEGFLWGDDCDAFRRFGDHYTVGDKGFLQGPELHILGRDSDMIITAGTHVYPHEVELALSSMPGVETAVAVGVPDDMAGSRVVAGIVASYGGLTATSVRTGLEELLSSASMPCRYYLLDELPVSDRGKINRRTLLEWIRNNDHRARLLR